MPEVSRLITCTEDGSLPVLVQDRLDDLYPAFWRPSYDYVAGEIVTLPDGTLGKALASFTSSGLYDAAEALQWTVTSGGTGGGGGVVSSVNGQIGDVTVDAASIGLGAVNNTADAAKAVASAAKLTTPRAINGVPFDGTADIAIQEPIESHGKWHDHLAFGTFVPYPEVQSRTSGSWNAEGFSPGHALLFNHREGDSFTLMSDNDTRDAIRFTWNSVNFFYCAIKYVMVSLGYGTGTARTLKFTVEGSGDGGYTWADMGTMTSNAIATTLFIPTTIGDTGSNYMRLTIERISGTGGTMMSALETLSNRKGDQGGGSEHSFPYSWDANQTITFRANPMLPAAPTNPAHPARKDYVDGLTTGKEPAITAGSASQFLRGDKTLGNLPLSVADGGSGRSTATTAYGLLAAGTTATSVQQTVAPGAAGNVLKSGGTTALPTWGTLTKADVGLSAVDNTSDEAKPVSTAQQTAINSASAGKEPAIAIGTSAQYYRGDKQWVALNKTAVGLSNVDDTSDATKNAAAATLTNKTLTDPKVNRILDANGNVALTIPAAASPVNSLVIRNSGAGVRPALVSTGESGVGLELEAGGGMVRANGVQVVDVSSAQTLSNKTLAAPVFTGTPTGLTAPMISGSLRDYGGAGGLWIGAAASLPGVGTTGVLYVTF